MPFFQTLPVTVIGTNLSRRVAFTACRVLLGYSAREATEAADEAALTAGSFVMAVSGSLTLDPLGTTAAASYLALEAKEAEVRAKERAA